MRKVWNIIFKGLAAVLPVTLTVYLIYWLSISMERELRPVISAVVPDTYYLPGMGLVAGLIVLYFVGLTVNAWIVQRMLRLGENFLERIPLVKSIYVSLHDFMDYLSTAEKRKGMTQVVLVTINDVQLLGFLTREQITEITEMSSAETEDIVAVYLPLSYQIGGYTIYLPRSHVKPVDMSMEDAMRHVLTGGLSKSKFNRVP